MKKMKIENKILAVNLFTVVSAILTLLSFSAMQGFSVITVVAICVGAYFAYVTVSFAKLEDILRKNMNNIRVVKKLKVSQNKVAKAA